MISCTAFARRKKPRNQVLQVKIQTNSLAMFSFSGHVLFLKKAGFMDFFSKYTNAAWTFYEDQPAVALALAGSFLIVLHRIEHCELADTD